MVGHDRCRKKFRAAGRVGIMGQRQMPILQLKPPFFPPQMRLAVEHVLVFQPFSG